MSTLSRSRLPFALRAALWAGTRASEFPGFRPLVLGRTDVPGIIAAAERTLRQPVELSATEREGLNHWQQMHGDAPLTIVGQAALKRRAANTLVVRARLRQRLEEEPAIARKPVARPIIIASLPRTGTTLTHRLFSLHPQARPLLGWEAMRPVLSPAVRRLNYDPRLRLAQRLDRVKGLLGRRFSQIHEFDPLGPEEDSPLLFHTLAVPPLIPSPCLDWYLGLSQAELAERFVVYRQVLQLLQWERPAPDGGFWALKSPAHTYHVSALRRLFPDAAVIYLHRRMSQVVPSFCSLISMFTGLMMQGNRLAERIPEFALEWCERGLKRFVDACDEVSGKGIIHVSYAQLVADPVATVQQICEQAQLDFPESYVALISSHLAAHPQGKHGHHRYSAEDFGLTNAEIDERFAWYHTRFNVPTTR